MQENKGRMLTASEVAKIWNERAREMGYPDTHYSRFSVRQRLRKGQKRLTPALNTPLGFLYYEKDAREIEIQPQKSKGSPKRLSSHSSQRSGSVSEESIPNRKG